jgi:hypothetical protein
MKKQVGKLFMVCLTMLIVSGIFYVKASAETVLEKESNDTRETAMYIQANAETAQSAANGTYAGQYVVKGDTSSKDTDWYRVYLNEGLQYITCNGKDFRYEIEDEAGNNIYSGMYSKRVVFGPTAYEVTIPSTGYYYVKIVGIYSTSKEYSLAVGGVTYFAGNCQIPCREGTVAMRTKGETRTVHFDGRLLETLPDDAIATSVQLSGVKTADIKYANLRNETNRLGVTLRMYSWYAGSLAVMNMPVESEWTLSMDYNRRTSFTPILGITYVYPVYSTVLQR